jgi:hypothetical protein
MEDAMFDPYGFRKIIRDAIDEEAERHKAELAAGVDAEREEEIKAWFLAQEARKRAEELCDKREEREAKHRSLSELPRPRFMN